MSVKMEAKDRRYIRLMEFGGDLLEGFAHFLYAVPRAALFTGWAMPGIWLLILFWGSVFGFGDLIAKPISQITFVDLFQYKDAIKQTAVIVFIMRLSWTLSMRTPNNG